MGASSAREFRGARAVTRLTDLPPEIICQILELLVPDPPELGDTRPVAYNQLVPAETWYTITRNRRALRQVCLTGRSLCVIAQPLLYRVISIVDEEGMLLLFRTLTERPDMGRSVRYFSCHLTLTRLEVVREMRKAMIRRLKTFQPDAAMLTHSYPDMFGALRALLSAWPFLHTSAGDLQDVPQILLFYVVSLMTKLETLMLQVPICDDHHEYSALFERLAKPEGPPFLRHVQTLLLQGDPELLMHFESDSCDCEIPELWGVQARRYHPLYNVLPNLTTLEVSCDDGVWDSILPRRRNDSGLVYLDNITELYLHDSIALPRDLNHILKNAPNLVTLYMTPRREPGPFIDPDIEDMDEHPESLDAALAKHAKHLRHLDVAWHDCAGNEALIGPEGRLTNLPRLPRLDKLCVQLCVLYGTDPAVLLTPIADLLPPNLVELTLEEWWWDNVDTFDEMFGWSSAQRAAHYQTRSGYRAQAVAILSRFAADCKGNEHGVKKMPRLKNVTFQTKCLWTWRLDGYVATESHFAAVKRDFAEAGIEFNIDEDQSDYLVDPVLT